MGWPVFARARGGADGSLARPEELIESGAGAERGAGKGVEMRGVETGVESRPLWGAEEGE